MTKPLIAIASNLDFKETTEKIDLNRAYSDAVVMAGGLPIVVPHNLRRQRHGDLPLTGVRTSTPWRGGHRSAGVRRGASAWSWRGKARARRVSSDHGKDGSGQIHADPGYMSGRTGPERRGRGGPSYST